MYVNKHGNADYYRFTSNKNPYDVRQAWSLMSLKAPLSCVSLGSKKSGWDDSIVRLQKQGF